MSFEYFHQPMPETHVIARFYERAVKTGKISDNGLPEIKLVPFVEIRIQDTNDVVDRPAKEGDFIKIDVEGNGFLYNMVRIIVGTLVDYALGKLSLQDLQLALKNGDRSKSGQTMSPYGLYLKDVIY